MCAVLEDVGPMISETDEILNDLLSRWHSWANDARTALGFPTESSSCKFYRPSKQYDWDNGASDQDAENRTMAAFESCVYKVPEPFRTALHFNARNLATGLSVWRSPRLPEDDLARALLLTDARAMLLARLREGEII